MPTQMQIFESVRRKIVDGNIAFMEMVTHPTNPLTRADLQKLIERRPQVYGRFSGWLRVLS